MTRRSLVRDARGATVVEFAIVAPVLVLVVLYLCDLTHTLYMNAALQGVVQKAARDSSLEDYDTPEAQKTLDDAVQAQVQRLDAQAKSYPTRRYYKTYAQASAKKAEVWTDVDKDGTCDDGEPFTDTNNNGVWDADGGDASGGAKDRIVYTVTVIYPRLFPVQAMLGLPDNTTVAATTVLENQPYADQESYAAPKSGTCK